MIIDTLDNSHTYNNLHPLFEAAFKHIESIDFDAMPYGTHDIQGHDNDQMRLIWGENDLKKPECAQLEVHNDYIDIQFVVTGSESFGWADRSTCQTPLSEFDTKRDIMFFDDAPSTFVTLQGGKFVIFMPHDAHAPLVGCGKVRKCIVKIRAQR